MVSSRDILFIGTFDTKGEEYAYLAARIETLGHSLIACDVGILATSEIFPIDIPASRVASAGGSTLEALRENNDRGAAIRVMCRGAAAVARDLFDGDRIAGVIGMGGSGGSSIVTAAMRALPVGVPKVCVSTIAGSDTSALVGLKDVTLIPSIVDIAGMNRISRTILNQAAGAICGMVDAGRAECATSDRRPTLAATMFGNTTECVGACRRALEDAGYEVLVFHATGIGGRTMESLVADGLVDGVLDITTTEWADEICGGVFSAGESRLEAPGRCGVPHLIVPGCVDMANFGPVDTVPQQYRGGDRTLYEWNPSVTLMRTTVEENRRMGEIFASKANAAKGPVAFLLPLGGVSILDGDGERFCDREADRAIFEAIRAGVRHDIPVVECNANINDPAFAAKAVAMMLELMRRRDPRAV